MIAMTSRCTSGSGTTSSRPAAADAVAYVPARIVPSVASTPSRRSPGTRTRARGDALGDRVEHLDAHGGPHRLDPDHRGVARDRDEARTGTLERHGIRDEGRLRALPLADEEGGAVGDAAVLPHEQVDVVLVARGVGELEDAAHEVHRRSRPEAARAPRPARRARTPCGHRATKYVRNLRTWFTWYATLYARRLRVRSGAYQFGSLARPARIRASALSRSTGSST